MFLVNNIQVEISDITKIEVDAIVNAANTSLLGGGGVDGAIHRKGGIEILNECRKIVAKQGGCKVGEAVITSAGKLPSTYVIHTVGPVWNEGKKGEEVLLEKCYLNSLKLAEENRCKTIAFPNISTGIYKFPKKLAAKIAVDTVTEFLKESEVIKKVYFVCFEEENYHLTVEKLKEIQI